MSVKIIVGDCREVLKTLPDASVQCCVTSPPYFGLRDYGNEAQIGLESTPDAYVAELVAVFREVRRVLRDDGTLFLNLGDSYFGGGRGGGGSFSAQRPGWREVPCGTSGKAPVDSQARGCLCGSLCDACRKAYQIGKSHSGGLHAPTLPASLGESTRAHKRLPSDRLPTSDLTLQAGRTEDATPLAAQRSSRADVPPLASLESTTPESSPQPPEASRLSGQPSECRLCGRSLERCAPEFSDNSACTCGTEAPLDASDRGTSGISSSDLAYRHLTTARLKPKDLIGIPWRVAFALQADGWWLRQDIIWSKPNPMPESVTDRCTKAHEYVFLLSKSATYYCDMQSIAEPLSASSVARLSQPGLAEQAGSDRVPGKTNGTMKAVGGRPGGKKPEAFDAFVSGAVRSGVGEGLDTRNKRSVWTITTQPFAEAHFATMAPQLAETCILAGCPEGGTVLDPFGGAGTTGLVADRLHRNAILIELNPTYRELAELRIAGDAPLFAEVTS